MNHVVNIAHGIGAGLAFAACFYLAGLVLTPRRWDSSLGHAGLPLLGGALYILLCWVAISAQRIPLMNVSAAFAGGVLVLSAFRFRRVAASIKMHLASQALVVGALTFAMFYVFAYMLSMPPASDAYLPPASDGNLDLLTHVRYARHLLLLGSPDLEAATFDYLRNPAISHFLVGWSLAFDRDLLSAAMPAQFALIALLGLVSVNISRSVFHLSLVRAFAIAAIIVTSPSVGSVAGAYVLAPFASVPVLLYLLWMTLQADSDRAFDAPLTVAFGSAYLLLFFVDPVVLAVALAMQAVVYFTLMALGRRVGGIAGSAATALAIVVLPFLDRAQWALANLGQSHALTAASIALAVMMLAALAQCVGREDLLDRVARTPADRRLTVALAGYTAIALIAGNVAVHAARDTLPPRMPGSWRGVAQLEDLPFGELTLKIQHDPDGLLAAVTRYFLPTRKVHIVGPGVRLRDLPFATISRQHPILLQNFGCEGVGRAGVTVPGVGCAAFGPPSLELEMAYPFNRNFLFVQFDRMTEREGGGRWNVGPELPLTLLADPERVRVDRHLYANLFVIPFLPAGVKPQRLMFVWGSGRTGETAVADEGWISVPVETGDWTGNRVWSLPISVGFPDGRTILFRDVSVTERPLGRLVQ